jgi:hypothetical protein
MEVVIDDRKTRHSIPQSPSGIQYSSCYVFTLVFLLMATGVFVYGCVALGNAFMEEKKDNRDVYVAGRVVSKTLQEEGFIPTWTYRLNLEDHRQCSMASKQDVSLNTILLVYSDHHKKGTKCSNTKKKSDSYETGFSLLLTLGLLFLLMFWIMVCFCWPK